MHPAQPVWGAGGDGVSGVRVGTGDTARGGRDDRADAAPVAAPRGGGPRRRAGEGVGGLGPLLPEVRTYLAGRGDVLLALLFGSLARGEASARSDVDVAVRLRPGVPRRGLVDPVLAIGTDLTARLGRSVDVLDLARASPALAFAVAADGLLLWECEAGMEVLFRAAAYDRYADTAPLRRLREAYLLQEFGLRGGAHRAGSEVAANGSVGQDGDGRG